MSVEALSWALKQTTGHVGRKAVLMALADCADRSGYCYPSLSWLSEVTEQSKRTVRRRLREMEDDGLLVTDIRKRPDGSQTSNAYLLAIPPGQADRPPGQNAA